MPKQIQAPDGSLVEFPDDMQDDAIAQVMRREYGGPDPAAKPNQMLGAAKGFLEPLARLEAGVEQGLDSVGYPASKLKKMTTIGGQSAHEAQDSVRAYFDRKRQQGQEPGKVGEAVGNIAASVPIMLATKNPWAGGALSGAFLSKADDIPGTMGDAAMGAAMGKVGDVAVNKLANFVEPMISPAIRRMADAGVKMSPGQIRGGRALVREDKRMSRPIVGEMIANARNGAMDDWNIATIAEVMAPLGIKPPPGLKAGHDAVAWAQDIIDQAYEQIVPKLGVKVDARFMVGLKDLADKVPLQARDEFVRVMKENIGKRPALLARQVKSAQSELGRLSAKYGSSANAYESEMGRILGEVKNNFDDMIVRQNPAVGRDLAAVNKAFRGLATIEPAAAKGAGGKITPAQLKLSARMADQGRRKSQTARGTAFMQQWAEDGMAALSGKTPDSGTAGRMQQGVLSNIAGGIDAMGYQADSLLSSLSLIPRPAIAGQVRKGLLTGKPAFSPVAIAATKERKR